MTRTPMMTPSMNEGGGGREARASIVQIRNQNAGQVALKARLFDNMTDSLMKSVERSAPIVKLPRVAINKKLESVKQSKVPSSHLSPRRSSRSPGVNRRLQLRAVTVNSPLKVIKENRRAGSRDSKINLLKNPELLTEIASPRKRDNRKVLSQNNTPNRRGGSRTPSSTKKHRTPRNTPSTTAKSPRSVGKRQQIIFD